MTEVLHIDPNAREDRFARFGLIGWWDQPRLASANVLVIGAGALGNEIIKNLALLGVGNVLVADLDRIEASNLSRSVLFREADCGRSKAEVAAERAREIYPQMRLHPFHGNVVYDLGLGVYRWADVILGGLDNREARVAINRAAAKVGKPWIDGAIERLDGVARVFDPAIGPCYECTMSDVDWKMLEARRSCALLSRERNGAGQGADDADHFVRHRRHPGAGSGEDAARAGHALRAGVRVRRHVSPELRRDLLAAGGLPEPRRPRADRVAAVERRGNDGGQAARAGAERSRPDRGDRVQSRLVGVAHLRRLRSNDAAPGVARQGDRSRRPLPAMRRAAHAEYVSHARRRFAAAGPHARRTRRPAVGCRHRPRR